ncbi:hypothetical protein CHELA1G11_10558 [Hyphomicrobiales bacterium]|nr:hypothetical protein CHELA1G11_10558 [Hyphomicrobiales bacterium]CAH1673831.1 hypothetical protein CHELA1G2_13745 [Hyphomicrobiales bacterium]
MGDLERRNTCRRASLGEELQITVAELIYSAPQARRFSSVPIDEVVVRLRPVTGSR